MTEAAADSLGTNCAQEHWLLQAMKKVDKQLCQMARQCQFTQYTASKKQFGIKLWTANTA